MARKRKNYTLFGLLWRLTISGAVVFALAAGGAYLAAEQLIRTPEREAPDLHALTLEEAFRTASEEGFPLRLDGEEPTSVLEPGRVLSQRPAPGMWVKEGSTLRVTIASRP